MAFVRKIFLNWENETIDPTLISNITKGLRQDIEALEGIEYTIELSIMYRHMPLIFGYATEELRDKRSDELNVQLRKTGCVFLNDVTKEQIEEMFSKDKEEKSVNVKAEYED